MKKACFLATSFFIILLGVEGLLVKKFVFKFTRPEPVAEQSETFKNVPCEFTPSPAVSWSLITLGGCLLFHTLATPSRW